MSTTDARPGDRLQPPAAPSVVADALLRWAHREGATAHALVRLRGVRHDQHPDPAGLRVAVVASQLRDNPPGYDILGDFDGLANAVSSHLIGPAIDRAAISWYAHHGPFSSYDPTGPDTLTRVTLSWDGTRYLRPGLDDEQLLTPAETAACVEQLGLVPVEQVLAAQRWDLPGPRRPGL